MDDIVNSDAFMIIVFVIGAVAVLNMFIIKPLEEAWENRAIFFNNIIQTTQTLKFKLIVLSLAIILFIIFQILLHKHLVKKSVKKMQKERRLKNEAEKVNKFLEKDLDYFSSKELKKFIEREDEFNFLPETWKEFRTDIKDKLKEAEELIPRKKNQEEERRHREALEEIKRQSEEAREILRKEQSKIKNNKQAILKNLGTDENIIYEADELSKEEINVLTEEGFKKITEFDPMTQEISQFYVQQVLNHSLTHTFLVERIKQMLEQHLDSDDIEVHDTRDADITFTIGATIYAFEIETGSLLTKKKQLKEKVKFLNSKYGINWYFIVTNRNLVQNYKKFGRVIPRKGMCDFIEKIADF